MGFCASWPSLLPVTARAALVLTFFGLFVVLPANGTLTQSRLQNRHLQRVMNHHRITIVLEGVRARALNSIKPDPILLINFPEIDYQFKVRDLGTYLYIVLICVILVIIMVTFKVYSRRYLALSPSYFRTTCRKISAMAIRYYFNESQNLYILSWSAIL